MEFKFEEKLDYQLDAIHAVVNLFEGHKHGGPSSFLTAMDGSIPNNFDFSNKELLENIHRVQELHKLPKSDDLGSMDFSVEMETGTGKTYVYLRTMLELNKKYGFKKFIIIVPSIAIKEGVIKTLHITKNHFLNLYEKAPYNFYEYDSDNLSRIRQFARNNNIEIMVMTIDSFNKDSNKMNKSDDKLSGAKPIDLVRAVRPILILDEPQNMESEKAKKALENLNPAFKLRYSATHKEYYNLIYRLSPVDAYNLGLVKHIEVSSVVRDDDLNSVYLKLVDIKAEKTGIKAKIEVFKKMATGFKTKQFFIKSGDDLAEKTENELYAGFAVSTIDARWGFVEFRNGVRIKTGEEQGGDRSALMKVQIEQTIEEHFRKAERLKPLGLKVLSLFFIDKVSNYADEKGFIRKTFIDSFNQLKKKYRLFANTDVSLVHKGYFAQKKTGEFLEQEKAIEENKDAYDLIMKDKERLLSFEEPTQFIFSHSALREGWDNPNVFNICTLNQTVSQMRKRQEIGRGVRLPVNQSGERIKNPEINVLTVIANESYAEYVSKLQEEYIDEYGEGGAPPKPANARLRKMIQLRKGFELNPDFKELWKRIARKTKYSVEIDSDELVNMCVKEINAVIKTDAIKIKVEKVEVSFENNEITTKFVGNAEESYTKDYAIPDILERISSETQLTKETAHQILSKANNFGIIFNNPHEYVNSVSLVIQEKLKDYLVNGIKYLEIDDWYEMSLFKEIEAYENAIVPIQKSIYEGTTLDSITEKSFAEQLEIDNRVKLFIKLPNWFLVKTPVGEYNPDWAIVFEDRDQFGKIREKLYLIRETKGVADFANLRPSEKRKILCAQRHFDQLKVDYKTVKGFSEII